MSTGCYWCGEAATSREHVPPKGLFPQGKNNQLITVPSCEKHNEALSDVDEKFRVFVQGGASSHDALSMFKGKTLDGLLKPEKQKFVAQMAEDSKRVSIEGQVTIALKVNPQEQNLYFEKIIRGLYFREFKMQTAGRVVSVSRQFLVPGLDYSSIDEITTPIFNLPGLARDGKTENPDIFRYKIARFVEANREAVAVLMLFYNSVEVLGLITPQEQ